MLLRGLSADFSRLGEEVQAVDAAGAGWIHVDVMDGRFVPNITIGPLVVEAVRRVTQKPLNVHLMIVEPEKYIADFAKAGADHILVQAEATVHLHRTLSSIKELGKKAGAVAGADAIVAGSAIFGTKDYAATIASIRQSHPPAAITW